MPCSSTTKKHARTESSSGNGAQHAAKAKKKNNSTSTRTADQKEQDKYVSKAQDVDPYEWLCLCPSNITLNKEEEESSDDDSGESSSSPGEEKSGESANNNETTNTKTKCDNGRTCTCDKPALAAPEAHPGVPYYRLRAAKNKLVDIFVASDYRCPDNFDMHVYNDFEGYGLQELFENIVLDFDRAFSVDMLLAAQKPIPKSKAIAIPRVETKEQEHLVEKWIEKAGSGKRWKDMWLICSALVSFLNTRGRLDPWVMSDESDQKREMHALLGTMFCTMLARLERQGLLKQPARHSGIESGSADEDVKDLPLVMGQWVLAMTTINDGLCRRPGTTRPGREDVVLAYAAKHGIEIPQLKSMDEALEACATVEPPEKKEDDPWGWQGALAAFKKCHGKAPSAGGTRNIGGTHYDITKWTSKERAKMNFDGKDPLPKDIVKALKEGAQIMMVDL